MFEELRHVFGQASAPTLRTVQCWIADIKDDSCSLEKIVPELIRAVENLTVKEPIEATEYRIII